MNRTLTFRGLFIISAIGITVPILTGCGGKSVNVRDTLKATATCDQNSALLQPGASYEIKSSYASSETAADGTKVQIASTNTLDYKVTGTKTITGISATDAQQTLTTSEVATNPDSSTLQVDGTNVQDNYEVLSSSNLLTYGFSETNTTTSPSASTPVVGVVQSTTSPALSVPAKPTLNLAYGPQTYVSTDSASIDGGKPTTNVNKNTITRTFSLESVTVPAGTFLACKEVDSTDNVNSTFGTMSHIDSTLWTVGSGPCQGLPLKRIESHSMNGGTSSESMSASTEEMASLSLNGQNCTE